MSWEDYGASTIRIKENNIKTSSANLRTKTHPFTRNNTIKRKNDV